MCAKEFRFLNFTLRFEKFLKRFSSRVGSDIQINQTIHASGKFFSLIQLHFLSIVKIKFKSSHESLSTKSSQLFINRTTFAIECSCLISNFQCTNFVTSSF